MPFLVGKKTTSAPSRCTERIAVYVVGRARESAVRRIALRAVGGGCGVERSLGDGRSTAAANEYPLIIPIPLYSWDFVQRTENLPCQPDPNDTILRREEERIKLLMMTS